MISQWFVMVLRLLKTQSISLWLGQGLQGARGNIRVNVYVNLKSMTWNEGLLVLCEVLRHICVTRH